MTTPSDDCYACAKMIISCPVHDVKPTADISASIDLRDDSDHESNSECEDSPQTCEWCGKTYDDDTAMSVHHWLSFGKYACDGPLCEECENNMTNEQMRYCVKTQDCDDCDCSCARAIDEDTQPGGQKKRLEKIDGSKKVWPEPSPTISPRLSSFLSLSFPTLSKMSSVSTPISKPLCDNNNDKSVKKILARMFFSHDDAESRCCVNCGDDKCEGCATCYDIGHDECECGKSCEKPDCCALCGEDFDDGEVVGYGELYECGHKLCEACAPEDGVCCPYSDECYDIGHDECE